MTVFEKEICRAALIFRKNQRVQVCLPKDCPEGAVIAAALEQVGAKPVFPQDLRWRTLLQTAFGLHVTGMIGFPEVLLGLSKLASFMQTPMYVRNALAIGHSASGWMCPEIENGLDCQVTDCLSANADIPDPPLTEIEQRLVGWSSVLDCRVRREEQGIALELVAVPGKQLPKLPTVARQQVHSWDGERDIPFLLEEYAKMHDIFPKSH